MTSRAKWKASALVVGLLAGLALPAPSSARPPGPPGAGPRLEHALEAVDLPSEVRVRVDSLLDASRQKRRSLKRSLRAAHDEMRILLDAESPDEAAILAQADRIGALQTDLEKDRLTTLLRIRAQLSPAQREKMTEALKAGRRGPPGGARPPPHHRPPPPGPRGGLPSTEFLPPPPPRP